MGKRSAEVELFDGNMGAIQWEIRPSMQREDQLTMETKLEQIAVKAVNQLPKSVVREIRTPRSVGAGGGRPPPATRWAGRNPRPYRDHSRRGSLDRLLRLGDHAPVGEPGVPPWTSEVGCGGLSSNNMRRHSARMQSARSAR